MKVLWRFFVVVMATVFFVSCGDDDPKTEECDPPCRTEACEECIGGECVVICEEDEECIGGECVDPSSLICDPQCDSNACEGCIGGECVVVCKADEECVDGDCIKKPTDLDGTLLQEAAASLAPGEWRNISSLTTWPGKEEGKSFKSFQLVGPMEADSNYWVDGIGWTQRLVYHNGALLILGMRDAAPTALFGMDPDGTWWRKNTTQLVDGEWVPDEMTGWVGGGWSGFSGGRRPFNRLTQDDEYLYFSRTVGTESKEEHGRTYRTPLDNPGAFEDSGHHGFGQSNIDTVGNHAILWVAEWNRFYAFTPGGHIRSRSPEDAHWHYHGRTPDDGTCRATGYAGEVAYNPIRDELIFIGGQTFGSSPDCSMRWVRMTEPFGEIEELPDLPVVDGEQLGYTSAIGKLFVHPHDGSYLLQGRGSNRIHRANDAFSEWTLYEDLDNVEIGDNRPFGNYEAYAPLALIPGTDVYVFMSHMRGVVLHRLRE